MRYALIVTAFLASFRIGVPAQDRVVLTGVVRDFAELVPKKPGGHPDFNPTEHPGGWEGWGCFDRADAAKGAVEPALGSDPANPDGVAGLIPFGRDDRGPILKPAFATPPNCFRSRFADWYTTRNPDVNRAFFLDLAFAKSGSVYTYDNSEFFPLDDSKVGSLKPQVPGVTKTFGHRQSGSAEGVDLTLHNFGFTFEFHARFTYKSGTGQRFAFRGDDDVWVYINDSLVIDLGGLHAAENAEVDLDALGLEDGKAYPLDFYFAERRYSASRLTITTSLELRNSDKPDPPKVIDSLPRIHIGPIKAEKGVTVETVPADPSVRDPFVLLTSDKVTGTYRDYVPLHPERAEDWIRRGGGGVNPGVVVFGFELSHPAEVELSIFDTQGQFVNKTALSISREDLLQSGLLSRTPANRAYLIRFAWYPMAHDGGFISTGAYILKARFTYGLDPRDQVAKGVRDRLVTFGFVRPLSLQGLE